MMKRILVFLACACALQAGPVSVTVDPHSHVLSYPSDFASKNAIAQTGAAQTWTAAQTFNGGIAGTGAFDFHLGTLTFAAGQIPLSALASDAITISGHAAQLGGAVTLAPADVGLGSVTNDAQTKAAIVPNTSPSAGQVLVGNAAGTAYSPVSLSGDVALTSAGAATVTIPWSAIVSGKPTNAAGYGITSGAALDSFGAAQSGTAQNVTTSASPTFHGLTVTNGSATISNTGANAYLNLTDSTQTWQIFSNAGTFGIYDGAHAATQLSIATATGNLTVRGGANFQSTTASTSTTTGALTVGGGAGIAGNLNVGGTTSSFGTGSGVGAHMLNMFAPTGQNAWLVVNRPDNTQLAITQFATGTTADWAIGEVSSGNSDFALFNYGMLANAITVSRSTGAVTLTGDLSVNGANGIAASQPGAAADAVLQVNNGSQTWQWRLRGSDDALLLFDKTANAYPVSVQKGSGNMVVGGAGTASSTTTGAFVVGSNVGFSGNAGGLNYFGGGLVISGVSSGTGCTLHGNSTDNTSGIVFQNSSGTQNLGQLQSDGTGNIIIKAGTTLTTAATFGTTGVAIPGTTSTFSTGNATISVGSFFSASRANPALRSDSVGDLDVSAGSGGALSLNYDTKAPVKTYGVTSILGTTTNDNAAAGYVGEYVSSTVASGSAVALTSGTAANVTSITLTAGDWDVTGQCDFTLTGASTTLLASGSSPTSATFDVQDSFTQYPFPTTTLTGEYDQVLPTRRVSIAATTTYYLVTKATFSAGTVKAFGTIRARRVR